VSCPYDFQPNSHCKKQPKYGYFCGCGFPRRLIVHKLGIIMPELMMRQIFIAASIAFFASLTLAYADPVQVMHAGEWESRVGDGQPRLICMKTDRPFDQETLSKMTQKAGAACTLSDVKEAGAVITYLTSCNLAGGKMILHGTITVNAPDTYVSRTQSHFEGGPVKLPDMDLTVASRRLGPCQPGDIQSPF
jgi:hypothetical protein